MTTATRQLGFIFVAALIAAACSSKDSVLSVRDGAVDQSPAGTGGAMPGTGGSGGSLGGAGGTTNRGSGGSTTGTGGALPGTGGSGSGGSVTGTGGNGNGGTARGSGGIGTGGLLTGTGGMGGSVTGTGGNGRGGSGSSGTVSTGGNSGGVTGRGGQGGQGGTGQGGTAWYDAGPDAASDVNPADCPASVPSGSCSVATSTICYYGDDARWFCKTSAKCAQGTWQVTLPLEGCTADPDPVCPADPEAPPAGICSADGGTKATCVYPTKYCRCGFTGGPALAWVCSKNLPAECPALRPGDGSSCTVTSGVWCTYGPSCSGNDMQCIEGKWLTLQLACG